MTRRIFVTILAVTMLAIVLFGVPLAIAVQRRNRDDAVLELQRIASAAASQVPVGFASSSDPVELPAVPPDIHLALYGVDGRRFTGSGPVVPDAVVRATSDGDVHDGRVGDERVVAVPVAHDEQVTGALRASEPIDEATDRTQGTWMAMAGLAVIVMAVAAFAALLLARHLTRPVRRLRDAAVRLGDGDFTVAAPTSGVAELDDAAAALTSTAHRLGGLVERERAFSADASHQLRNPLASLRLAIETELARPRADPTLALHDALDDVDRLEATLTQLLALARDAPDDRGTLELTSVLGDVERRWHNALTSAGRPLRLEIDDATPLVHASATAVSTVVDVLVDNAVRHGQGAVTVTAGAARPSGASITVTDEGQLAGDPNRVFDRRSSGARGHGIGLALARSLAHAEGGRLRVARRSPTTFELLIAEPASSSATRSPEIALR